MGAVAWQAGDAKTELAVVTIEFVGFLVAVADLFDVVVKICDFWYATVLRCINRWLFHVISPSKRLVANNTDFFANILIIFFIHQINFRHASNTSELPIFFHINNCCLSWQEALAVLPLLWRLYIFWWHTCLCYGDFTIDLIDHGLCSLLHVIGF